MLYDYKETVIKYIWISIYTVTLVWSGINPKDQLTWLLEVSPAIIAFVVMALTYKKFRLTTLVYTLILFHCVILMVGGHYTYAEVPLFDYIKELSGSSRNNYDKVGHFVQGFVPALVAREIILRKNIIEGTVWQGFFIVSFCLAFSAFYELIEWWVALASGESAVAFLGTQGYIWDTQSDMGFALLGALVGLISLSQLHNRQLANIKIKHWQEIYTTKPTERVGWYTPHLSTSITWIDDLGLDLKDPLIDVGGGASTLIDDLLHAGYTEICVLDLSDEALSIARERIGNYSNKVTWLQGDITRIELPADHFKLWHDRAVFHFLVEVEQRKAYRDQLLHSLKPDGHFIIGTFNLDGPPSCSGLPVQRYSATTLASFFEPEFKLVRHHNEVHTSPSGMEQNYLYCQFERCA